MSKILLMAALPLLVLNILGCSSRTISADQICSGRGCFTVEVVQEQADMQKGLQNRLSLPKDHGMLFVFGDEGRHVFWMKDTLIPLDMIWLDYTKKIVHIEENVPPCTADPCPLYSPPADVQSWYVLEINAGQSRALGMKQGDTLEFRLNSF